MELSEIAPTLNVYRSSEREQTFDYKTQAKDFLRKQDEKLAFDKIIFIVHGFRSTGHEPWMLEMKDALFAESPGKVVVLVGWAKGAYADGPRTEYFNAVENMEKVSKWLAGYVRAVKDAYPEKFVHGIGHSLGTHLVGLAGRESDRAFDRITGLDPAGPWFQRSHLDKMLCRTDSNGMVDVIHTDGFLCIEEWIEAKKNKLLTKVYNFAKGYLTYFNVPFIKYVFDKIEDVLELIHFGTLIPLGNVDFYPNYGVSPQPGSVLVNRLAPAFKSHSRAHELFICSIKSPGAFKTRQALREAPTFDAPVEETRTAPKAQMGYFADRAPSGNGNYYLKTNGSVPWETRRSKFPRCAVM